MTRLLFLFATFFRIDIFAVGGGLATVPFLFELADSQDWLGRQDVGDMLAVAQSLPGAIGVNLAAYTGIRYAGIPGAFVSALGIVIPSIGIIIIVARMLRTFRESPVVTAVFSGFRPAAAGLLSAAGFGAIALSLYNPSAPLWYERIRGKETALFAAVFLSIAVFKKHPALYILAAGAAGLILKL
jgi:chromate transporter